MPMFNSSGQPVNMEALINTVVSVSGASGVLLVSSLTAAGSTNAISANQSLSAVLLGGTANIGYVSAFVDNGSLSAKSSDAGTLLVSAKQGDAGLLRVSSIGGSANDILVDGTDNTVSARIKQISAVLSASDNALIVQAVSEGAGRMQVSAKSNDGALLRTSAIQDGAAALNVSAKSQDGALLRVSVVADSALINQVSAKSGDGALLRTSAIQDGAAALNVSAKSNDGSLLRVSVVADSALINQVSAKSLDAGLLLVSAKQGDAGLLRVSGFTATATNFPVSSTQADASLLRISSFESVAATATGGASLFSTSAGIAVVSAIKSTAGRLYGYHLSHGAGVDQYLTLFDNASSAVTLGTTVPTLRLGVPAGTGTNVGAGAIGSFPYGIAFSTAITAAVVSGTGGDGNTAGASAMRVNLFYA